MTDSTPPTKILPPVTTMGCVSIFAFATILSAIIVAAFISNGIGYIFSAFIGAEFPTWFPAIATVLGRSLILGLALLPLALFWPDQRYQTVFQAWTLALVFGLLILPVWFVNVSANQTQAILHILGCGVYIVLLIALRWGADKRQNQAHTPLWAPLSWTRVFLAALLAALASYPWLAWGALGSMLDTFTHLAAGLALGLSAALTLELFLLRALREHTTHPALDMLMGSLATGGVLMLMAVGLAFSFNATQRLLVPALPVLGWALVGLSYRLGKKQAVNWLPPALLIGLFAAAPMAFTDIDEMALIFGMGQGEILSWATKATYSSAVLGLILGLLLALAALLVPQYWRARPKQLLPALSGGLLVIAGIGGILIYALAGQPGFHGEKLFVILRDQADLSGAAGSADYTARRQYVYGNLTAHAEATQADLRAMLDRFNVDYTPYYLVNALEVDGGPVLHLWLETRPEVDRVLMSAIMRPLPEEVPVSEGDEAAPTGTLWNLNLIGADRVWEEFKIAGQGVIIGQSDTGVQWEHPELTATYRGREGNHDYNWFDPWYGSASPVDRNGHGTHTLGTILGQTTGIAPQATWYACANLRRNMGNPALYLDCMQFMLAPFPLGGDPFKDGDPARGAQVLNNSWGCPEMEGCDPEALLYAVRALRAAGVFVVASAGNDGPGCASLAHPIALYDEVFTVGAIDMFSELASLSSVGPVAADGSQRTKPDIVAPGVDVFSAWSGGTYNTVSGTSMAGPHVAGVVALMWSANPGLIGDIERTEAILAESAQPYTGLLPACEGVGETPSTAVGYGILDAYEAVRMALEAK